MQPELTVETKTRFIMSDSAACPLQPSIHVQIYIKATHPAIAAG